MSHRPFHHRLTSRTYASWVLTAALGVGTLAWTDFADAQGRSSLVDVSETRSATSRQPQTQSRQTTPHRSTPSKVTPSKFTQRSTSRARVPDARLYDDMTVITQDNDSSTRTTSARKPSVSSGSGTTPDRGTTNAPARHDADRGRSGQRGTDQQSADHASHSTDQRSADRRSADQRSTDQHSANQHSSAPSRTKADSSTGNGTLFASATIHREQEKRPKRRAQQSSQAYVPMLPKDFYSSTNVRKDPVAAEVGIADMQPADNDSGGFSYLERQPLNVSKAKRGIVQPYKMTNVFSTFGDCRPGGRTHAGLDIGGVGPNGGIGTPIYAMSRVKVTYIGRPHDDPDKFGQPDQSRGYAKRGPRAEKLPRTQEVPGYGVVNFFTRTYGSWRTGTILVMEGVDGPLKGHRIRYMHLGEIHPELRVGDIVEGGQEVGLMGGTAVQHDMPHMHIDIETADGKRVDVAPYVGLPADNTRCR